MTELFRLIGKMSAPSQIYIYVMMALAAALLLTMIAWWIQAARWARSDFRVPGWGVGALHRSLDGWVGVSTGRTDPVEAFRSAVEDRLDGFRATANLLTLLGLLGTVAGLVQISGGLPQILRLGDSQASQLALGESMGGLQLAFVSTLVGVAGALIARGLLIPISSWVSRAAARYGTSSGAPEEAPSTDDRLDTIAARLEAAAAALHALTAGAADDASPLVATSAAFERAVGQLQAGIQAREQTDAEARRAWDAEAERRRREAEEMLARIGREWSTSVGAMGREWTGAVEGWSERQQHALAEWTRAMEGSSQRREHTLVEWTRAMESSSQRQEHVLAEWTRAMENSSRRQEHALGEWSGRLSGHGERMEVLVTGIEAGWAAAAAELAQAVSRGEERQIAAQERLHERLTQEIAERERAVDAQLQRFGGMWDASTRQLADRVQSGYDSVGRSTELLRTVVQGVEAQLAEITAASTAYQQAMESVGAHLAVLGTGTEKMLEQVDSHLRRLADAHVSALQGAETSLSAAIRGSAERLDERMDQAVAALSATTARIDTALRTVEEDRARAAAEGASLATAAAAIGDRLAGLGEQDQALLLVTGELRESLYAADALLQQLSDHLAALHAPEPVPGAALLP